jgi:NAD(P)-dependent dehydrogenase (short-subunit alcohol dehydrogenase family)
MDEFTGKGVFITGGASGIGLGMARAFARAGAKVAIADIETPKLDEAKASILDANADAEVITIELDVSDRAAVQAAADLTAKTFGKVHILCNNAGVGSRVALQEASSDDWDWVIGVNLQGAINGLLAFLPLIQSHGEAGHILATSSVSGLRMYPNRQQGMYCTTKYGLVGMSEALADDLAPLGIGVSVICPGFVTTNLSQSERNRPTRFAKAVSKPRDSSDEMRVAAQNSMDPDFFGERILASVKRGDFYILTDDRERDKIEARFAQQRAALDQFAELNESQTP